MMRLSRILTLIRAILPSLVHCIIPSCQKTNFLQKVILEGRRARIVDLFKQQIVKIDHSRVHGHCPEVYSQTHKGADGRSVRATDHGQWWIDGV